jgi:hypothetical protein
MWSTQSEFDLLRDGLASNDQSWFLPDNLDRDRIWIDLSLIGIGRGDSRHPDDQSQGKSQEECT